MAEPKLRFTKEDGSNYPAWKEYVLADILTERNEPHLISADAPQLSFTIEQGVIYPEHKKTNKRDFLMKDKDNKKFLLTEYNDIIYNPANLKFGAIHRNALGRGVVSPIYAIFQTNQNPEFIEGIVTNPKFIKSALKFLEGTVEKLKTLKPRDFIKMHVWIPCLEEQKKIARFLASVDEVIANSEREVSNLETQKKAVVKKIFSQEVRFKRADGRDFPYWEKNALCERTTHFRSGKNLDAKEIKNKGKYPVIGGNGIRGFTNTYNHEGLYAVIGRQGALCGNINLINGKNYLTEHAVAVRGDSKTDTVFLSYLLDQMNLRKYSGQSAQPGLAVSDIIKLTSFFPCLEEQHFIADFLSDFDEAIAAAKKELELWKKLKKGLLQQMFV